ncbi:hypothetical protein V6259_15950 [Marinomonas sp. TI.3.20]|uniref:hypothetical protein n=1 Tax=Marinomonas sp. TI.3.20 TaxID=3121296 RepID=UPI00311E4109
MYLKILSIAILLFAFSLHAATLESRMKLLQQLDMLDGLDFQEEVESANDCIRARNFGCAEKSITAAEDLQDSNEQMNVIASVKQSLFNERAEVRREIEQARQQRIAQRERDRQRERDIENEKRYQREVARLQRESANTQPQQNSWAVGLGKALDSINARTPSIEETSRNLYRQINKVNQDYAQAQRNKKKREQAYLVEKQQAQNRLDQQRQDYIRRQAELARQQKAQLARLPVKAAPSKVENVKEKEKYQLVVEALAFCWEHQTKKDNWRCRGPSHSRNSTNDATSVFQPGLLAQVDYAGCSNASLNNKRERRLNPT